MTKYTIIIEVCSNCKEHAWCTRHNQSAYQALGEELRKAIQSKCANVSVSIHKVSGPKMGSFEVICNGVNVFSKLALGYFPHTQLLTNRIAQFIEDSDNGQDLQKYKYNFSPLKNHDIRKSPSKGEKLNSTNKSDLHANKNHSQVEAEPKIIKKQIAKEKKSEPHKEEKKVQVNKEQKKEIKKKQEVKQQKKITETKANDKKEEKKEEKKQPLKEVPKKEEPKSQPKKQEKPAQTPAKQVKIEAPKGVEKVAQKKEVKAQEPKRQTTEVKQTKLKENTSNPAPHAPLKTQQKQKPAEVKEKPTEVKQKHTEVKEKHVQPEVKKQIPVQKHEKEEKKHEVVENKTQKPVQTPAVVKQEIKEVKKVQHEPIIKEATKVEPKAETPVQRPSQQPKKAEVQQQVREEQVPHEKIIVAQQKGKTSVAEAVVVKQKNEVIKQEQRKI